MRSIVYTILVCFILAGCSDNSKNIFITGRVVNPITGYGIPDVGIKLYQDKNGKQISIESVRTDQEGNFIIAKNALRKRNLVLIAEDYDSNYPIGWTRNGGQTYIDRYKFEQINVGGTTDITYHITYKSQFYIKFKNVNCGGTTDTLIYKYNSIYEEPSLSGTIHTGCLNETSSNYLADGLINISYKVIRNGISTDHSLTVNNNNSYTSPTIVEY